MLSRSSLRLATVMVVASSPLVAQVPQLLNFQGRVRVSGADFTGTGQFKFAMVSSSGGTTYWSNDGSSSSGSQPTNAVSLTVTGGLYQVLLGDATLPNMVALPPSVFTNSDATLRVWFSDGVNGWQQLTPDQRVAAVGYAMMADNVRDGAVTSAKLAENAITASKIATGAVTAAALSPTAVTQNLAAAGQGTVPSGASLISTQSNSANLLAAGYVESGTLNASDAWTAIGGGTPRDRAASVWTGSEMLIWGDGAEGWRYNPATNIWTAMSTDGQPSNRENPLAVWTGSEMIVWGGRISSTYPQTGGRYNPSTNTWSVISNVNAPAGRFLSTAIWTGAEMIIFGGSNGTAALGDGARYNPNVGGGGTWNALPATNAPAARQLHTAVWTGSEMIIHGGLNAALTATYGDCKIFNPAGAGTWTTGAGATGARYSHTAVWTGTAMLVWGGSVFSNTPTALNTGGAYNRAANTWGDLPTAGAPAGRIQHSAVWTGTEMIVWGGSTSPSSLEYTGTGGRYNPTNSLWNGMTTSQAPASRVNPKMEWTGSELLVWGGSNGADLSVGGRYRAGQTYYLYQRP